jgi:hypothetical protein
LGEYHSYKTRSSKRKSGDTTAVAEGKPNYSKRLSRIRLIDTRPILHGNHFYFHKCMGGSHVCTLVGSLSRHSRTVLLLDIGLLNWTLAKVWVCNLFLYRKGTCRLVARQQLLIEVESHKAESCTGEAATGVAQLQKFAVCDIK